MSIFKGISDDLALRATTEKGAQGSLCFDELQVSGSKFQVADLGRDKKYFGKNPKILFFGMIFGERERMTNILLQIV